MKDLRAALHDIADDAPDLDNVRRRVHRPSRRNAPVWAAAAVIAVVVGTAGTAVISGQDAAPPPATAEPVGTPAGTSTAVVDPVESVTSTSAVIASLTAAAPSQPWAAVCFGAADLSTSLRAGVGLGQKVDAVNTAPRPEDYFTICGAHWQTGTFTADAVLNPDYSTPPVPEGLELVGCVLPDGTYGIFPGTDATCGDLGLPVALAPDPAVGVIESPVPTG